MRVSLVLANIFLVGLSVIWKLDIKEESDILDIHDYFSE